MYPYVIPQNKNAPKYTYFQDTASRLEEELRAARVRTDDAENEAIRWRQQAQHAHDELQAQTVQFHQRISQRERELDSLRHQVLLKSGTSTSTSTSLIVLIRCVY